MADINTPLRQPDESAGLSEAEQLAFSSG